MLFSWHRDVIVGDAFLRPKAGLFHIKLFQSPAGPGDFPIFG